ncbi:hypothetical protein GLYMA_09G105800v4 [Glycine max]|nr:hypothetical protein GLYMA_09G105800v4 [Glycine max]KAH1042447.1 hypothetical protein GYH30_024639 [Glycine max]
MHKTGTEHIRVLIPIRGIKEVNESQNVNKAEQKYLEIVTEDYSEFWFVGFLRYDKALKHLNKAISMANKWHPLKKLSSDVQWQRGSTLHSFS